MVSIAGCSDTFVADYLADHGYARVPAGPVAVADEATALAHPHRWWNWPRGGGLARASPAVMSQWCVHPHGINPFGPRTPGSVECVTAVAFSRECGDQRIFGDVLGMLRAAGVDAAGIVGVVEGDEAGSDRATGIAKSLAACGVPVVVRESDGSDGGGPVLVRLLCDLGADCSPDCSPSCLCGRLLPLADLDLTRRHQDRLGLLVRVESVAAAVRAGGATTGFPDMAELREWVAGRLGADAADAAAHAARSLALLLGLGVVPGPRGAGHVVRRLVTDQLTRLFAGQVPLDFLDDVVCRAAELFGGVAGFPFCDAPLLRRRLHAERVRFGRAVGKVRQRYVRTVLHRPPGDDAARALAVLMAEHGAPLGLLVMWLADDGIAVPSRELARLTLGERSSERGAGRPESDAGFGRSVGGGGPRFPRSP
ncbi:hypothetical protein OG788_42040 [Streptomyces sp. NBC_00647]|uniref:hypothetical protein n=1 Tax=Streptomyces sp. NBC_00647 TaxID=2975796 RepID=UPI00324C6980